jgi:hypothetical protein
MLRTGLEVSDVIVEDNDVFGRGVNLAARLMSLAGPGEIVVSQHVRDGLTPSLDADVEDLGDCYVKGIPQPVRAYRVGPPGPQRMVGSALTFDELAPSFPSKRSVYALGVVTRGGRPAPDARRTGGVWRDP